MRIVQKVDSVGKYESSFSDLKIEDVIVVSLAKFNVNPGAVSPTAEIIPGQYSRSVRPGSVLSWMSDRCAVNEVAIKHLLKFHRGEKNMACLSHTLTHPSKKFCLAQLPKFRECLYGLMHQSLAAAAY